MPYRVRDENGNHITVAVVHEGQTVLEDHPATNEVGQWLPPKMKTSSTKAKSGQTSNGQEAK